MIQRRKKIKIWCWGGGRGQILQLNKTLVTTGSIFQIVHLQKYHHIFCCHLTMNVHIMAAGEKAFIFIN